jgi:transposase-like protein
MTPERPQPPQIIDEINRALERETVSDLEVPSVESIALKLGINSDILYRWVTSDREFSESLDRLKKVQENDPFKTGDEMDVQVDAAMIALLLMETRDRRYKSSNQ